MVMGVHCSRCSRLKRIPHPRYADVNRCYCGHLDAEAAFRLFYPDKRDPGYIGSDRKDRVRAKELSTPRWCPARLMYAPTKISTKAANAVISNRILRGLFYCKEGDTYVGIANEGGDAFVEEFPT